MIVQHVSFDVVDAGEYRDEEGSLRSWLSDKVTKLIGNRCSREEAHQGVLDGLVGKSDEEITF